MGAQQFGRRQKQTLAQCGQGDGLIIAIQQAPPGDCLKPLDMHAHRRRAFMQLLGRRTEFANPRHRMKCAYQLDIEYRRHDLIFVNDCCTLF
jgi:hypothetical protein